MLSSALLFPFLLPVAYAQLNDLAKAAGLKYFGAATDNNELTDSAYVKLLSNTSEFGQITPGNSQKWDVTEPSDGRFTFTAGDVIPALAEKNAQLNQLPTWVTGGIWTHETLQLVMKIHITTVMEHYKGQCYAWDVVNEALDDDANFRTDVFYNAMGEDYIRFAFEMAALADPDVKLYYNDYNIEYAGAKATAALSIVTKLVNEGVKIDGVGLQGHFIVGSMPLHADFVTTMETYTALGLEVAFTEMDIRMTVPSTDALLAQQSLDFQNIVSACVEVDNCIGITVWDFDDKYSWVPNTFPGLGAACLFDEDLNRKPAYYGVVSALKSVKTAVSTSASTTASATIVSSSLTTKFSATVPSISTSSTTSTISTTPTNSSVFSPSLASKSESTASTTLSGSSAITSPSSPKSIVTTSVQSSVPATIISSSPISVSSIASPSNNTVSTSSTKPVSSSAFVVSTTILTAPTPSGMTTSYVHASISATSIKITTSSASSAVSAPEPTPSDSGDDDDDSCE